MILAAFDLDGTLTHQDSMFAFLRYVKGSMKVWMGLVRLGPMLWRFKQGKIKRQLAKERLLAYFLGGMEEKALQEKGADFCKQILPKLIRPAARKRLNWHRRQGHQIVIVTASLDIWTRPWAEAQGFSWIGSEAAYEEGIFQGKLRGKNCHGPEKVRHLKAAFAPETVEKTYAYGDTAGDRPMLEWANEGYFRPFHPQGDFYQAESNPS
ncbi:MAG: HAD family hydrolase [Bacteroidota bacterium]